MRNIMLIGFMGTGKSTVAACMNREYGMEVIEMDALIEEREQMRITEIFEKYSEKYFRDRETALLSELQNGENRIISCGGGVVLREENIRIMKQAGVTVLLKATPKTILERVRNDDSRPLLRGKKDIDSVKKLLDERNARYEKAADIVIATDKKTASEICREIMDKVQEK